MGTVIVRWGFQIKRVMAIGCSIHQSVVDRNSFPGGQSEIVLDPVVSPVVVVSKVQERLQFNVPSR